jgi:hypothetical protein
MSPNTKNDSWAQWKGEDMHCISESFIYSLSMLSLDWHSQCFTANTIKWQAVVNFYINICQRCHSDAEKLLNLACWNLKGSKHTAIVWTFSLILFHFCFKYSHIQSQCYYPPVPVQSSKCNMNTSRNLKCELWNGRWGSCLTVEHSSVRQCSCFWQHSC